MKSLSLTLAALAAALSLAAHAQSAPKRGTVDDLRGCLNTQDDIEARQAALRQRGEELTKTADALGAQSKELNEEGQRALEDAAASGRRTRYERKERAFKQETQAHRTAQEAFNADRAKLESDFAAFREKCANVAYLQADIDKVRQERAAAGKK